MKVTKEISDLIEKEIKLWNISEFTNKSYKDVVEYAKGVFKSLDCSYEDGFYECELEECFYLTNEALTDGCI